MTRAERWQRIQELFDHMVESPVSERHLMLGALSGPDEELRGELEGLLAASELARDYLEHPPIHLNDDPGDDMPVTHLEPYRLLRRIGQGGSSVVYLAARADDAYRKRVAIKILAPGRADADLLRRFKNERQILASLTHPYIAELYDGGSTEEGLPYFVMEYVEGLPIDEYCVHFGLGLEDRLRLFRKICEAVQHAHQSLVIHRDIKPSNILVTEEGVPKLLDFGIAKLLNPELVSPDLTPTATWYRPFTPHYASPEQIQGRLITTRSDVYSLGVLLYLLLTDQLPYRLEERSRETAEQIVAESRPLRPSLVVRNETPEGGSPNRHLGLRPDPLSRKLAGDLDTIVLNALRKEPGRRYASVEEFSSDVRRHLEGRPVLARQDTLGYRVGKFVGRNRLLVSVVGLFLSVVTGLLVFLSLQSDRLARERDEARQERDKSAQVLRFLQDVFSEADPVTSGDAQPTALQILDRSTEKLQTFSDQPEVQVTLMITLAQIFLEQGRFERAEPLFRNALDRHRSQPDADPALTTEILGMLGINLRKQDRLEEAEAMQLQALALRREVFGDQSVEVSWSLNDLGVVLRLQGRYDEAERLYLEILEIQRRELGPRHEQLAVPLGNLATVYVRRFRYREAEAAYREALDIRLEALGPDHLYTAFSQSNLAYALIQRRQLDLAEQHLRAGLSSLRNIFGEHHSEVSRVRVSEAQIQRLRGNLPAAEALLQDLLARTSAQPEAPDLLKISIRSELALIRQEQGDLEQAEVLAGSVLNHRRRVLGEEHPDSYLALDRLAEVAALQGQWEISLSLQQEALAGLRQAWGEDHPGLAPSLSRLARLHAETGDWQQAEPLFVRALELIESTPERQPDSYSEILARQGEALLRADRPAEAEPLLRQALEALKPTFPASHHFSLRRREALDSCLQALDLPSSAGS